MDVKTASSYLCISDSFFRKLAGNDNFPKSIRLGNRKLWCRFELESYFQGFSNEENDEENEWDKVLCL